MSVKKRPYRALPYLLCAACFVPVSIGAYRVGALAFEWDWALQFAADQVDNLPLWLHAIFSIGFLTLGALQLVTGLRNSNRPRHRKLGKYTFVFGVLGASSGLYMTLSHPDISGPLLHYGRLLFACLWIGFLVQAVVSIRNRDIPRHRANMIRAYAIAINAGTLPFIYLPILAIFGEPPQVFDEIIQVGGWVVNLSIAEWWIRRRARRALLPAPKSTAIGAA